MPKEEIKELNKKIQEAYARDTALMWKSAPWFYRVMIIWGIISLIYVLYKLGQYLRWG